VEDGGQSGPLGLVRGGTWLNDTDEAGMYAVLDHSRQLDEQALRQQSHARYMRFYRSVRSNQCPPEIQSKYMQAKGRGDLKFLGHWGAARVLRECVCKVRFGVLYKSCVCVASS